MPVPNPNAEAVFAEVALTGPARFFADLMPAAELEQCFRDATPQRAREYFVLRTLAEVQKYGLAARRWIEVSNSSRGDSPAAALQLESLDVEQAAWQRRLLEALLLMINFSTTNEQPSFADYLALMKHERARHQGKEEKDFFGATSELTRLKIAKSASYVESAIQLLPPKADRWYASSKDRLGAATARSQFLRALPLALPSERTALGYTYGLSFGDASASLHFTVLETDDGPEPNRPAVAFCGLLAIAIIGRAHDLCSVVPTGVNAKLLTRENRERPSSDRLANVANVGDFVVVGRPPMLGEVIERRSTLHGYDCYLVEFLDAEQDKSPTPRDWIPAPSLARIMRRDELVASTRQTLAQHADGHVFSDSELLEATRAATLESWRLGLRSYTARLSAAREPLAAADD